ncbi:VOC family protein [Armatimonas sp.]|uniref:VOC family protein n=1 Tax=Armatimonas sp. TaxID=1872638 RepID=UPI00286C0C58|nr:VOC family protein [Armatimonas sp.]
MNLNPVEIKAFVPALDFTISKAFYEAIGFEIKFTDNELAYLLCGNCSFLLHKFPVKEFAENLMMHLLVESVEDWHAHLTEQNIAERFGVRLGALETQPWGMRDFVLFDPSGVLWRIAQNV